MTSVLKEQAQDAVHGKVGAVVPFVDKVHRCVQDAIVRLTASLQSEQFIVGRLCVFRSLKYIYAQLLDDTVGRTLVAASSLDPDIKVHPGSKTETAKLVGALLGKRALDKGIEQVAFDRGGYKYHGRIKALADAAREAGLKF